MVEDAESRTGDPAPGFVDGDAPTDLGAPAPEPGNTPPVPGAPTVDPHDPATWPGTARILRDRYLLEEPIASGGAAVVWRAFDTTLSRSVAIKLLHPHLASHPPTVERFKREAKAAAQLTHPNVVAIYDSGETADGLVFLVMEYVDGPSLREVLRERGKLDPGIAAALGEQVAAALGEAHARGLIHRDVKPANILLTDDGVAKVTDFGIAKALSGQQATLTAEGTVVGTAAYVAPEQLEAVDVDARTDVYALGIVLFECLVGRPAFEGDTPTATAAARLTRDLPPPRTLRADVPRPLDDIIVRATRRNRDQRYADGAAFAAALAPLVRARPSDITAMLVSDEFPAPGPSTAHDTGPVSVTSDDMGGARKLALAFGGGLVLALVALLAADALQEGGGGAATSGDVLSIAAASDFDPHGTGGREENPIAVPASYDGDPETRWTTERYNAPLAQLKAGVGIWFDLGVPQRVSNIELDLPTQGMAVAIYARDAAPGSDETEADWGQPWATFADLPAGTNTLTVPSTDAARFWLVWLTRLSEIDGGRHQGGIAEVRFVAP